MSSFAKSNRGLILHLDATEVPVLRSFATEVLEVITARDQALGGEDPLARMVEISTNDKLPENPILARLFPNAYDDEQLASEFRRYTETSLHGKKEQAIANLLHSLPLSGAASIKLDEDGIDEWLRAINDLRLALGVILDIDENSDKRFADTKEEDPEFYTLQAFYWLGWLQENLIEHATY